MVFNLHTTLDDSTEIIKSIVTKIFWIASIPAISRHGGNSFISIISTCFEVLSSICCIEAFVLV